MINNLYIVMPAYNEAENIETTIKEWYPVVERLNSNDCKCHLVIANDGSKDNTYHKMLGLRELYPMLIPLDIMVERVFLPMCIILVPVSASW